MFFRKAAKRGPWPDDETCGHLATYLSGLHPDGEFAKLIQAYRPKWEPTIEEIAYRERWIDAVRTLRETDKSPYSFGTGNEKAAQETISVALDRACVLLNIRSHPNPNVKKWAPWAIACCFTISEILKDDCGQIGGTSANSVAAKFTSLAFGRLGWRAANGLPITARAIGAYCNRPEVNRNVPGTNRFFHAGEG